MYHKCHKVNFRRDGSYIDSPDWIKKKKAKINPENKNDKCFQYTVTVALSHGEIKYNPERASNIRPFINKYKSKRINYLLKIGDWKMFENNNPTIDLNIACVKEKEICPAYISKINSNWE